MGVSAGWLGSQPRITAEGKSQADPHSQQPRRHVGIARGRHRLHRLWDGV